MSSAREEILARVRTAKAAGTATAGRTSPTAGTERAYRRTDDLPHDELVGRFCERVDDYRAEVERLPVAQLHDAVAAASARHRGRRLVVPPGLPDAWRPPGLELIEDHGLSARELDAIDGVISGCTVAIAETGTIALTAGAHEGRRQLSLVPDLHICVVREQQIVAGVPEAIRQLDGIVRDQRRPITLISGPSATSDIELQRVEGVHGPRRLVVLVVSDG